MPSHDYAWNGCILPSNTITLQFCCPCFSVPKTDESVCWAAVKASGPLVSALSCCVREQACAEAGVTHPVACLQAFEEYVPVLQMRLRQCPSVPVCCHFPKQTHQWLLGTTTDIMCPHTGGHRS